MSSKPTCPTALGSLLWWRSLAFLKSSEGWFRTSTKRSNWGFSAMWADPGQRPYNAPPPLPSDKRLSFHPPLYTTHFSDILLLRLPPAGQVIPYAIHWCLVLVIVLPGGPNSRCPLISRQLSLPIGHVFLFSSPLALPCARTYMVDISMRFGFDERRLICAKFLRVVRWPIASWSSRFLSIALLEDLNS